MPVRLPIEVFEVVIDEASDNTASLRTSRLHAPHSYPVLATTSSDASVSVLSNRRSLSLTSSTRIYGFSLLFARLPFLLLT